MSLELFEIPGANVRAVGIRFPYALNGKFGRNIYKNEKPVGIVVQQGIQRIGRRESPVLVGGGAELQEGGPDVVAGISDSPECERTMQIPRQYGIKHFVIGLDISGSMAYSLTPSDLTTKIQHIKERIQILKNHGLPDDTLITLLVFNNNATVAKTTGGIEFIYQTNLKTLLEVINDLLPSGSTNIKSVLDLACEKIKLKDFNPESDRAFFMGITDGRDDLESSPEHKLEIFKSSAALRDINVGSFYVGVGADYSPEVIYGLASHAGFAAWGHTPASNKANMFNTYAPFMIDGIQSCEFYPTVNSVNTVRGFAITPSIRDISPIRNFSHRDYIGYQKEAISIFTEQDLKKEELAAKFLLKLQGSLPQNNPDYTKRIVVIDFDDAPSHGLYEDAKEARIALVNLLKLQAMQGFDIDAFNKLVNNFPDVISDDEAKRVRELLKQAQKSFHQDPATRNTVLNDISCTSCESVTRIISRTELSGSQVNPFSIVLDDPNSLSSQSAGSVSPLSDSSDINFSSPVESSGSSSSDFALHSGHVGPLDVPPPEHIPAVFGFDPAAYENVNPIKLFTLQKIRGDGKLTVNDFTVGDKEGLIFGRNEKLSNVVISNDKAVSKKHFSVFSRDGKLYICDLGSTNGTSVNRIRINVETELNSRDIIRAGTNVFKIEIL